MTTDPTPKVLELSDYHTSDATLKAELILDTLAQLTPVKAAVWLGHALSYDTNRQVVALAAFAPKAAEAAGLTAIIVAPTPPDWRDTAMLSIGRDPTPDELADAIATCGNGCPASSAGPGRPAYLCTRSAGHDGLHIATDSEGTVCAFWDPALAAV